MEGRTLKAEPGLMGPIYPSLKHSDGETGIRKRFVYGRRAAWQRSVKGEYVPLADVAMGPLRAGYLKYQTSLKRRVWNAEVSDRLEW